MEARPGLIVRVRDKVTGENVLPGSFVRAIDGSYVDSVHVPLKFTRPQFFPLANERAGMYTVVVDRSGYVPFKRRGVRVGSDGCHVTTVVFEAMLEKKR
jgi:hypothetical protein